MRSFARISFVAAAMLLAKRAHRLAELLGSEGHALHLGGEPVHRLLQVAAELVLRILDAADRRDRLGRLVAAEDVADAPEGEGHDEEAEQNLGNEAGALATDRSQHKKVRSITLKNAGKRPEIGPHHRDAPY